MARPLKKPQIRKIPPQESNLVLDIASRIPIAPAFNWNPLNLQAELEAAEVWGAFDQSGELRAFVAYRALSEANEITVLATDPEYRGQGWMLNLLKDLFNAFGQKTWWLEVHESNYRAISLYKHLGFKESGRRYKYYKDGGDALLMSFNP